MRQPRPLGPGSQRRSTVGSRGSSPARRTPSSRRISASGSSSATPGAAVASPPLSSTPNKRSPPAGGEGRDVGQELALVLVAPANGIALEIERAALAETRRHESLDGGEGELVEPLRQHGLLRLDFAYGLEHGRQGTFVEGHHPAPLLADQPRRGPRVVVEPSLVGMVQEPGHLL